MILDSKPLDKVEENDLQVLIDDKVAERKRIEYKRDLPGNSYKDRKEFLADVSSFANTVGGYLLYGVDAKDGVPVELCGVEIANVDDLNLTWENRLRDGLSPQIPPFNIQTIELAPNNYVIILHIPRSWLAPHRVTLENHRHFYGRNSAGHFQMDVPQLRTAFELSGTLTERIRDFRADRISKIISGEMPASLNKTIAKIVFHLVPFGAFELTSRYDLSTLTLPDNRALIMPLVMGMNDFQRRNYCRHRYDFDGLLNHGQWVNDLPVATYLHVFRNGIVEGVDASILNMDRFPKQIPSIHFEQVLCYALSVYLQTQKILGVDLPIFAMLSLLEVKDYRMVYVGQWPQGQQDYPIDRPDLVIPEVMIDRFDCDLAEVMKPIFDTVWNAAGWKGSMHYDATGKWKLPKL
jgi:Putative DNA-binding domain